jgi:hypothetical protein
VLFRSTATCEEHYYFKEGKLFTVHTPGMTCLCAPGDTVWQSDLEALQHLVKGAPAACSLDCVAAKYLINERREP